MNYTIKQFRKDFPDDEACLNYLFRARFGNNPVCPRCGKTGFYHIKKYKCYDCAWCGYHLHPLADTIFRKSSTKLTDWFFAIYLMSNSKNGVSAKELQRHLGVTYKTAWRMAKQIRSLMKQGGDKFGGTVEADETYIGGKRRLANKNSNKEMVVGMVQRGGSAKATHLSEYWTPALMGEIEKGVAMGTRLITDENPIYKKHAKRMEYFHDTINHSKKKYVKGDIHTNTIEGFWGQMKRSIDGTYHAISKKYLQSYVDEFVFQYNQRSLPVSSFEALLARLCDKPYQGGQKMPLSAVVRV